MKKIKKLLAIFLASQLTLTGITSVNAFEQNNTVEKPKTPYEMDRMLYGDYIETRVVIYDAENNYINEEFFESLLVDSYALVPGEGGGNYFYEKYFSKVEWIIRNGVVSLSLTPMGNVIYKDANWDSIYQTFHNSSYWQGSGNPTVDSSMYNQFVSHYDFSPYGDPGPTWDLEPSRVDKGYWGFVVDKCN